MPNVDIKIPKAYKFLLKDYRYKISYGGRAAARTWSFVRAMLIKSLERKRRILCTRYIQNSIRESIHETLRSQIELLGLSDYYDIQEREITCKPTGSAFIFMGLYKNFDKIKSMEGLDIIDIEEADSVSDECFRVILPTLRRAGSELWARFNTKYDSDAVYERFVAKTPPGCYAVKTTYRDNPHFPEVLKKEMEQDRAFRPHEAKNIWDGELIGTGRKIYPMFDRKIHVKEFKWEDISKQAVCYMAMDPASKYYPACLWLAQFPHPFDKSQTIKWVYNEWPTRQELGEDFHKVRKSLLYVGSIKDMATELFARDGQEYGLKVKQRFIDTRFAKGSGSANFSSDTIGIVQQFAKRDNGGMLFNMPFEKIIDVQRDKIIQDMQYNTLLPISDYNMPNLYISPRCHNLIESLSNHRCEEDSEKESEKFKDFSDCARILYAGFSDIKYKDPSKVNHDHSGFRQMESSSYQDQASGGWMT